MRRHVIALLLFLGSFGFFVHFAAPSVTTGDSGEFITAAATLSLAHAPSFPAFTLMAKSWISVIPFGSIPLRCNYFSSFMAAAAVLLLFLIGLEIHGSEIFAVLTALMIATTTSFLENSLVTEVFALNTFFMVLLVYCLLRQSYALFAFVLGLGLGNHQILMFLIPAAALAVYMQRKTAVVLWAGIFLLGLSIYLTLPIRSAKEPPLNWGQPTTVQRFVRTLTRADYGSMKLATGDTPDRSLGNTQKHLQKFTEHLAQELPLPALLLGLYALVMSLIRKKPVSFILLTIFVFSGPFFFWLGNLPFTAQSDGIVGRFMIMPVIAFLIGVPLALERRRWMGMALLIVCILASAQKNLAMAEEMRTTHLVLDYGRAMLRSLPANAAFFMDGGDDAFYSLAMLHYVGGRRPDVMLHDRGGLVFKNPYGPDFRSIPKDEKTRRRWEIEKNVLATRPLYYSTMDSKALEGVPLTQTGFVMRAGPKTSTEIDWPIILLRSLYPLEPNLYRMRALAAFFPYMRGRDLLLQGHADQALPYFQESRSIGYDVEWLSGNLDSEYANAAYAKFVEGKYPEAELLYRHWISLSPDNLQANSNYGVVLEKLGRISDAKAQYEKTKEHFPSAADPAYNLSVLAWKEGNWAEVVAELEEVLRRNPNHPQAQGFLRIAREKMKK